MRKLPVLLALLGLSSCLFAQSDYYVISVKEKIWADNKPLLPRDKLPEAAKLRFSSRKAVAKVVSPGKGFFYLSPQKSKAQRSSEFIVSLRDALIPPGEYRSTSSRLVDTVAGLHFDDVYDMMGHFRQEVVLLGDGAYPVNADNLPMDSSHYFVLARGETEQILPFRTDTLLLLKEPLGAFAKTDTSLLRLSYHNTLNGKVQPIGVFRLRQPHPDSLRKELLRLQSISTVGSELRFFQELALPYVRQFYGRVDPLAVWDLVISY